MSDTGIHKAIIAVMREIGAIGKDSENVQQHYKFRSVEQVYNRVQPLFAKHGIFSYPKVVEQSRETRKTAKGGELLYAILTVEYTFAAEDGSSISAVVVGEAMDSGDKASNKAMAAAHKYAICQVLNIPYDVIDPDKFTPDWAAKLAGKVTLERLRALYRAWLTQYGETFADLDKTGKLAKYTEWVGQILGGNFSLGGDLDVTNWQQWTVEEAERCEAALNPTEETCEKAAK